MKTRNAKFLWSALGAGILITSGCSSLAPPPERQAPFAYIPHEEYWAKPGSAENPEGGTGAIAELAQMLVYVAGRH